MLIEGALNTGGAMIVWLALACRGKEDTPRAMQIRQKIFGDEERFIGEGESEKKILIWEGRVAGLGWELGGGLDLAQ